MKKIFKSLLDALFSDRGVSTSFVSSILLCFFGLALSLGLVRCIFNFFKFRVNPINLQPKEIKKEIKKDSIVDVQIMPKQNIYKCSHCGTKYRYFISNCENCGSNEIEILK